MSDLFRIITILPGWALSHLSSPDDHICWPRLAVCRQVGVLPPVGGRQKVSDHFVAAEESLLIARPLFVFYFININPYYACCVYVFLCSGHLLKDCVVLNR